MRLKYFAVQADIMKEHLKELHHVLSPGVRRHNWNSLTITDYTVKCQIVKSSVCIH